MMAPNHAVNGLPVILHGKQRQGPSTFEWNSQMPTISRLYMDEDRTLKEVVRIMRVEHGFIASEKMFKTRLISWGLRKNIRLRAGRDDDVVQTLASPTVDTQPASYWAPARSRTVRLSNGLVVDADRLAEHVRRKRYRSKRSNSPPITTVRPPDSYCIFEAVFSSAQSYILGRFQGVVTTPEALDKVREADQLVTRWVSYSSAIRAATLERPLLKRSAAAEKQMFNDALVLMRRAPQELGTLIRHQPANVTGYIFFFLMISTRRNVFPDEPMAKQFSAVVKALMRYMAVAFSSDDAELPIPLRQLLRNIASIEDEFLLNRLAVQAWKLNCKTWESLLGGRGGSKTLINDWLSFQYAGESNELPKDFGEFIEDTLRRVEPKYGPSYAQILWYSAHYRFSKDKDAGLDPNMNEEIVAIYKQILLSRPTLVPRVNSLRMLAEVSKGHGDGGAMEGYLREAIDVLRTERGEDEPMILTYINELEGWLDELGLHERAKVVADWKASYTRPSPE
ncbi:Clr5 domain-containing protein [Diaporthe sp. PMI_573]|nr:Clr5 domain-containing protein [Diaporthaceae sp. PMI_573]